MGFCLLVPPPPSTRDLTLIAVLTVQCIAATPCAPPSVGRTIVLHASIPYSNASVPRAASWNQLSQEPKDETPQCLQACPLNAAWSWAAVASIRRSVHIHEPSPPPQLAPFPLSHPWSLLTPNRTQTLDRTQSAHMAFDTVDESAVYLTTGNPMPADVEAAATWLLNEPLHVAFQSEQSLP